VSSGPRYRKFGRIVDTVNTGYGSSVVGGCEESSRAVDGERGMGVAGVCGVCGVLEPEKNDGDGGGRSSFLPRLGERRRAEPGGE